MKFGFIGAGNMGGALARAVTRTVPGEDIMIADASAEKAASLAKELGAEQVTNVTAAYKADVLFLGVKPQMMEALFDDLLVEVLRARREELTLVSMAAGVEIEKVRDLSGGRNPVIRIMPNTPCAVGEGMILFAAEERVTDDTKKRVMDALSGAGRLIEMSEDHIDAGTAVSGCGPAYVDLFIEALADGGVAAGLSRAVALELAEQTVLGSARLLIETGQHPAAMKDAVCSPGGSTIEGVRSLEGAGFRSAVIEAVISAWLRNRELG